MRLCTEYTTKEFTFNIIPHNHNFLLIYDFGYVEDPYEQSGYAISINKETVLWFQKNSVKQAGRYFVPKGKTLDILKEMNLAITYNKGANTFRNETQYQCFDIDPKIINLLFEEKI